MSFNPIEVCYSSSVAWRDVTVFVLVWVVPTVLLALRTSLPEASRLREFVRMALPVASAASMLVIAVWLELLGAIGALAVAYAGLSAAVAVLGVRVYRRLTGSRRAEARAGVRRCRSI